MSKPDNALLHVHVIIFMFLMLFKNRFAVLLLFLNFLFKVRAVAQPGSALRSGRRGRWFESSLPDGHDDQIRHQRGFGLFHLKSVTIIRAIMPAKRFLIFLHH